MQIIVEFIGGPRDGQRLIGNADDETFTEAACVYHHTGRAKVGSRFWCASEYALAALRSIPLAEIEDLEAAGYRFGGHVYEVIARIEGKSAVRARARHLHASE